MRNPFVFHKIKSQAAKLKSGGGKQATEANFNYKRKTKGMTK